MTREPRAVDELNIVLDPAGPLSLQHQLRYRIIHAIHSGVLRPGRRLPSSRALAARIGVSRNTVGLAYDALIAEGHLVSRARSGIFVASDTPSGRVAAGQAAAGRESALAGRLPAASEDGGFRCPNNWHHYPFPFIDGRIDPELLPVAEWREAMRLASSRHEAQEWNRGSGDGDDPMLLDELRGKVLPGCGIDAGLDQLLVTLSARHALQLVGDLLLRRGVPVVLEAPVDAAFERRARDRGADVSLLDPDLARPLPPGAVVVTSARRAFEAGSAQPQRLLDAVAAAGGVLVEQAPPSAA
ncbi:MAG: GntR family transcriptional regulator, partial [Luteimonas sp.]|nr:GntR family transcriptional regulator [Luteimonas sp.]